MADYPIVYVRGYAMSSGEVEDTFNMPYYGFNIGSTQIRASKDEAPEMRIFESPVVRLIKEEGYADSFNRFVDARNSPIPGSVPHDPPDAWRRTLWIFRFYDSESQTLGRKERGEIEDYAEALAIFLEEVRGACGNPADFRVNLVAHSMGGLVCRCYLQNTGLFRRPALRRVKPVDVHKLFTYGTPHRGITFRRGLGWAEDVRDLLGVRGSDTFGEKRMREFLSLRDGDDLYDYRPARGRLDLKRIFCVVGTNWEDYTVHVSRVAVGPGSDGLVAVENAYVHGASRAYIHRAHSGPLGMVNSEEGYQNLIRFLFGDVRVEIALDPVELARDLPGLSKGDVLEFLLIDVDVAIRGLPAYVQTRREETQSAIIVPMTPKKDGSGYVMADPKPIHLFTGFLRKSRILAGDDTMRGAVQIRVEPHYAHAGWVRASRFEGESILNDRLHLGIREEDGQPWVVHAWGPAAALKSGKGSRDGSWVLPLPAAASRFLRTAGVRVSAAPWE